MRKDFFFVLQFCNFAKNQLLMITISDSARDRLLQIMSNENSNKEFVRVGVESGGCSGLSYKLEFDTAKNEDDELIKDNKIQLLINKKSYLYLVGTTLEFSDGLNGKGFVLTTLMQVELAVVEKVFHFNSQTK